MSNFEKEKFRGPKVNKRLEDQNLPKNLRGTKDKNWVCNVGFSYTRVKRK